MMSILTLPCHPNNINENTLQWWRNIFDFQACFTVFSLCHMLRITQRRDFYRQSPLSTRHQIFKWKETPHLHYTFAASWTRMGANDCYLKCHWVLTDDFCLYILHVKSSGSKSSSTASGKRVGSVTNVGYVSKHRGLNGPTFRITVGDYVFNLDPKRFRPKANAWPGDLQFDPAICNTLSAKITENASVKNMAGKNLVIHLRCNFCP